MTGSTINHSEGSRSSDPTTTYALTMHPCASSQGEHGNQSSLPENKEIYSLNHKNAVSITKISPIQQTSTTRWAPA